VTAVLDDPAPGAEAFGTPAAIVVAATGGGNTTPGLLDLATVLMDRGVPVALTTRCPAGEPRPGYGFPGGSTGWWNAGAVFSGTLGPLKSRVLLALAVGAGLDIQAIAALCEPFGGGRKRPA
jgi:L-asparaginase